MLGWTLWLGALAVNHGAGQPPQLSAQIQPVEGWQVVRGDPSASGAPGIQQLDDGGEFFVVSQVSLNADQLPLLTLQAKAYPLNYVLMAAWKQRGVEQAYFTRLQVPSGATQSYLMSRFKGWSGELSELVLYGYPQPQTSPPISLGQPIVFQRVGVARDSWQGRLAALWTGWTAADPWAMLSVSSLGRYPDLDEGVGLVPAVAGMTLIALFSVLLASGLKGRKLALASVAVVLLATMVLQWQFTRSLFAQVTETRARLADLSPQQRSRFQFDQELIDLTTAAKPLIGPDDRVHAVTDDRFFSLRAAWHLRPANVSTFYLPSRKPAGVVKSGDLMFIYRQPELPEMIRQGEVRLGGERWKIEPLLSQPAGALLRLLHPVS